MTIGNSSNGHAGKFFIDTCKNITISNNRAQGVGLYGDTIIVLSGNDLSCWNCGGFGDKFGGGFVDVYQYLH